MSEKKIAVVTGSNKGIGFAIVQGLCQRFDGLVYLTSRNEELGKAAAAKLKQLDNPPHYHQLDVSDKESMLKFRDYIEDKHGGIDILINNAGVSGALQTSYEDCKRVIDINFGGIVNAQEYLFPLLRDNARVLNISSDCGHLSNLKNMEWIKRLSKNDLSKSDIDEFVNWYLESMKTGTFKKDDFVDGGLIAAYRVAKIGVCALTMIQQRELEPRGISVNSMHPGLVSTSMTMGIGFLTPDQAAETPLDLVLDAPASLRGKYVWYNGEVVDWFDYKTDKYYFRSASLGKQLLKNLTRLPADVLCSPSTWVGVLAMVLIVVITKIFQ
ncbi:carbonyl reductase [NADPH] 1-like [Ostrinia furnacalis]|uniref:carbonyl reductase [NADPH] 1-like n=1 Tax=Ostrinia furnacalis TaxID=93504 RepID=UPI00103D0D59|nr:carbonyl reductase [NADPH] 1-like [Ostrinia furnacalis]